MHRNALASIAVLILFALAACDQYGEAVAPNTQAFVRLVNVSHDAPELSLFLSEDQLLHANVPFPGASDYVTMPAQRLNSFAIRNAQGNTLTQTSVSAVSDGEYSIVVYGPIDDLRASPLRDDNRAANPGATRFRIIHTAQDMGPIDLYITEPGVDLTEVPPTLGNTTYEAVTAYADRAAGNYRIRTTLPSTKTVLLDSGPLTFSSRGSYTVFMIEDAGGGEPYGVLVTTDFGS